MKKLIYKETYKRDPRIVHTCIGTVAGETCEEFLARKREMDEHHFYEVLEIRDMTPAEIEQYNAENAAADYYARYGTMGEF